MAKHKYKAHVTREGDLEETIFERLGDAPAIPARYVTEGHGKFKDGREYSLDPEKVEEAHEAEIAEVQIEQAKEEVAAMKTASKASASKSHK